MPVLKAFEGTNKPLIVVLLYRNYESCSPQWQLRSHKLVHLSWKVTEDSLSLLDFFLNLGLFFGSQRS